MPVISYRRLPVVFYRQVPLAFHKTRADFIDSKIHTRQYSKIENWGYWERLRKSSGIEKWEIRFPGKISACMKFKEPYLSIQEFQVLTFGFLILLEQYAYNIKSQYVKFTIGSIFQLPNHHNEILCPISKKAIPILDSHGNKLPKKKIDFQVEKDVRVYGEHDQMWWGGETDQEAALLGIFIDIYYDFDQTSNQKSDYKPIGTKWDKMIKKIQKVMYEDINK